MSAEADTDGAAKYAAALLGFVAELRGLNLRASQVQHRIDGIMYTSTKLPARAGLELLPRITALLGSGFLRLIVSGDVADQPADRIAVAMVAISDRAMRDGLVPLVLDLLARTQCGAFIGGGDGPITADRFDQHFAGEYMHLLRVAVFVLSHNFRGPTLGVH